MSITELLGHDDIDIRTAATGAEALKELQENTFDCAVLDLRLPDMSGFDVLERIPRSQDARRPAGIAGRAVVCTYRF